MVAIENASLQPAPAIIRRCSSLLAFKIARYSFTFTFLRLAHSEIFRTNSSPRSPLLQAVSESQILRSPAESSTFVQIPHCYIRPVFCSRIGAKNCTSPIPIRLATVFENLEQWSLLGIIGQTGLPGNGYMPV